MKYERILLDVETQKDFFSPDGSIYTPQAREAERQIYRLVSWARKNQVPVISTVLRVRRDRLGPLAPVPHCVDGSQGNSRLSAWAEERPPWTKDHPPGRVSCP